MAQQETDKLNCIAGINNIIIQQRAALLEQTNHYPLYMFDPTEHNYLEYY